MGVKNKITDGYMYFLTLTVVNWVDVFTRPVYKHIIVDALQYNIQHKGLVVSGWCLMSNHLHLLAEAEEGFHLSDILRDFKKFTGKAIIKEIIDNPVKAEIVAEPEDYLYSSAKNYAGEKGLVDIVFV
ncbi:MAG TPA: transposase [Bacteroidetes bacterium]|nr:transposase [Bacteroidota bacterium]